MVRYITLIMLSLACYQAEAQTTHLVTVAVNQGSDCPALTALEESTLLRVFPNPASHSFTIQSTVGEAAIKLIDIQGRLVYEGALEQGKLEVDITQLKSGIYILHLAGEHVREHIKIRVQ